MQEFKDKKIGYLWKTLLYTSLFFLLFFVLYGFKTATGDVCTSNSVSNDLGIAELVVSDVSNYSFPVVISDTDFQNVDVQNFCLKVVGSTNAYNTITHLDQSIYVNNLTEGVSCFNNLNASKDLYKVLNCIDCDTTNNVTLSLSNEEVITLKDGVPTLNNNLYYQSTQREGCEELYKTVTNTYFSIIGLILGIFLIMLSIRWFEKFSLGGW